MQYDEYKDILSDWLHFRNIFVFILSSFNQLILYDQIIWLIRLQLGSWNLMALKLGIFSDWEDLLKKEVCFQFCSSTCRHRGIDQVQAELGLLRRWKECGTFFELRHCMRLKKLVHLFLKYLWLIFIFYLGFMKYCSLDIWTRLKLSIFHRV